MATFYNQATLIYDTNTVNSSMTGAVTTVPGVTVLTVTGTV